MTLSKFSVSQLVFQGVLTLRSLYKERVPFWPVVQEASVAWPFEMLCFLALLSTAKILKVKKPNDKK